MIALLVLLVFFVQVFRSSNITVDMDLVRQIEAKYPALLFKQQLTAYVEKIYGMIRDNLKKEISPLLGLCIQVYSLLPLFLVAIYFKFALHDDSISGTD